MTELVTEMLAYLAIAALLGILLGYVIWGWGHSSRIAAARAEGAASARTSVDGSADLKGQLKECGAEVERLEREVATLRHRLEAQHEGASSAKVQPQADSADVKGPEKAVAVAKSAAAEPQRILEPEPILAAGPEPRAEEAGPELVETETTAPPSSLLTERPEEVDDLKKIRGVGPKMEGVLNAKGVYLFHQVANFTPQDVAWVNEAIEAFPGRIERDNWVDQAQTLYREKYGRAHDAD